MGKVFSWAEVESGRVPRLDGFAFMLRVIKEKLEIMPEVLGAAICGSAVSGGLSVRSDIDLVVVYESAWEFEVIRQMQKIQSLANKLLVPIELILVSDCQAKSGDHNIDHGFWQHLVQSAEYGGLIKQNPGALIELTAGNLKDETCQYIVKRIAKIKKSWTSVKLEGPERYRFLGKLLATPIYVARKTLTCYNSSLLVEGDGKAAVLAAYRDFFKGNEGCLLLQTLVQLDQAYTDCLMEQLATPRRPVYRQILSDIEGNISLTMAFLEENLQLVRQTQ